MIQNVEVLNRLSKESKSAGFDIFPRELAKKIQPIIITNVDNKLNTFVHSVTRIGGSLHVIFVTSPERDTYIIGCSIDFSTLNVFAGVQRIEGFISSGESVTFLSVRSRGDDHGHVMAIFPSPIKLLRGVIFTLTTQSLFGSIEIDAHVFGFEVDTLEKADG